MNGKAGTPGLRLPPALWVILAACTAIEAVLSVADLGLAPRLRGDVFRIASFRPDLLSGADPAYAGQRAVMFFTYSLLHAGFTHFAVNMLTLLGLGTSVVARAGQKGFLEIYLASVLGGAVGYALIGSPDIPMVGASGALFGLAGALIGWEIAEARARGASVWPSLRLILLLAVLNFVLWWVLDGRLAWETHLGGALAGLALALTRPAAPVDPA